MILFTMAVSGILLTKDDSYVIFPDQIATRSMVNYGSQVRTLYSIEPSIMPF
jgi:hypothetical protein